MRKLDMKSSSFKSHFIFLKMKKRPIFSRKNEIQNENDFGENLANIFIIYQLNISFFVTFLMEVLMSIYFTCICKW